MLKEGNSFLPTPILPKQKLSMWISVLTLTCYLTTWKKEANAMDRFWKSKNNNKTLSFAFIQQPVYIQSVIRSVLLFNVCHGDTCKIEGVHDVERVVNEKSKTCDPLVKEGGGSNLQILPV